MTHRAWAIRKNITKLDYFKNRSCSSKDNIFKNEKASHKLGENISDIHNKGIVFEIYLKGKKNLLESNKTNQ